MEESTPKRKGSGINVLQSLQSKSDVDENRHSHLKDVVGEMTEVTKMLSEAVKQQNNSKDKKKARRK